MPENTDHKKNVTIGGLITLNVINIGIAAFWAFDGAIMPLFLTAHPFNASNTTIGIIISIGKVMTALSMFFGVYSDMSRNRFGKRRPIILGAGLLAGVVIFALPNIPFLFILVPAMTVAYFGIQMGAVSYQALIPETAPNEKLGTAFALFNVTGGVGTLLAYLIMLMIIYPINKPLAFYALGVLHIIGVLVTYLSTKEHLPEETGPRPGKLKAMVDCIAVIAADLPRLPSLRWFLVANLFFWATMGTFTVYFTKYFEFYVNIPVANAGLLLGIVIGVSILLAFPVGMIGDKVSRKRLTLVGLGIFFAGLIVGYLLIGPNTSVAGRDIEDPASVRELAEIYGHDISAAALEAFPREPMLDADGVHMDINGDGVRNNKSDVMRACMNGAFSDEECIETMGIVMGKGHAAFDDTLQGFRTMRESITRETQGVLVLSIFIITLTAVGVIICMVMFSSIRPTIVPDDKLGLYMGLFLTVNGFGQVLSITLTGIAIDYTLSQGMDAFGYRMVFLIGAVCCVIAAFAVWKTPYLPSAGQPTVGELLRREKGEGGDPEAGGDPGCEQ